MSPALRAHIKQEVTSICTCMEIVRQDGKSYRFTDHDQTITIGEKSYVPYNSFARTSIASSLDIEVDDMSIKGILNSAALERDDIASGMFDTASVAVFVVNWENPEMGQIILRAGWLGEIKMNEDYTFEAEIRGKSQAYTQRVGEAYSPECRADLGDFRCKVALNPAPWEPDKIYAYGDTVVGIINPAYGYYNLDFVNASFDDDGFQTLIRNPEGWTSYGNDNARWTIRAGFYNTPSKFAYACYGTDFERGSTSIGMYQDIDLIDQGVPAAAIDGGLMRLYTSLWHAKVNEKGSGQYTITALTAGGLPVQQATIYDSGNLAKAEDTWYFLEAKDILIPPGTRKLRFDLKANKVSKWEEGYAFDTITAAVNDPDGTYGSTIQYGDVAFIALGGGVSGSTEPAWSNLIGTEVVDNTITWKAVKAWRYVCEVQALTPSGAIIPDYLTQNDGYFDGGLLRWETGRNAGKAMEVKSWKDGTLRTFFTPFYQPAAGDRFVLYPGCDKTRATCAAKFANILNFRGEPDVPGQDSYYAYPNAPES